MASTIRRVIYPRPKLSFLSRSFAALGFGMNPSGMMILLPGGTQPTTGAETLTALQPPYSSLVMQASGGMTALIAPTL